MHLRAKCDKPIVVGRDEVELMRIFRFNLSREALELFISHDTNSGPAGML